MAFDWSMLSEHDQETARRVLGEFREPDLDIQPDGQPYLYRWWVIPRNIQANVYFHIQVASDPERPLHDHPWDNQSVILSGEYLELYQVLPPYSRVQHRRVRTGMTVHRKGTEAHRLILPPDVPYTMTLFTTGPTDRKWGYWMTNSHTRRPEWVSRDACVTDTPDGRSVFKHPRGYE